MVVIYNHSLENVFSISFIKIATVIKLKNNRDFLGQLELLEQTVHCFWRVRKHYAASAGRIDTITCPVP